MSWKLNPATQVESVQLGDHVTLYATGNSWIVRFGTKQVFGPSPNKDRGKELALEGLKNELRPVLAKIRELSNAQ